MAVRKSKRSKAVNDPVTDYRHQARGKHIPPAGLAAQGEIKEAPKLEFAYNPHLPPVLRFDPTGCAARPLGSPRNRGWPGLLPHCSHHPHIQSGYHGTGAR